MQVRNDVPYVCDTGSLWPCVCRDQLKLHLKDQARNFKGTDLEIVESLPSVYFKLSCFL
jgi:hypothetical protein